MNQTILKKIYSNSILSLFLALFGLPLPIPYNSFFVFDLTKLFNLLSGSWKFQFGFFTIFYFHFCQFHFQ